MGWFFAGVISFFVLFLVGLFVVPPLIRIYNKLVWGRNKVHELWANIDVQLKRRHELIPNLVSVVKGYAKHEETVFTRVTEARSLAMAAKSPNDLSGKENELMAALGNLYVVAEQYPELKASSNFLALQKQLAEIEHAIQEKRTKYNRGVSRFNTAVQSFPINLVAGVMGFKEFEFFGAPEEADESPDLEF